MRFNAVFLVIIGLVVASSFASSNDCLNFVVVGDQGAVTKLQQAVANSLGEVASGLNASYLVSSSILFSFVVALGDNFYEFGVSNVDDPQFETKFEAAYSHKALQIPWYIVAGNHDYYGNYSAQIEYTNKSRTKRWIFPSLNYDKIFTVPNSNKTVHIIFFDTFHLTTNSHFTIPVDENSAKVTLAWLNDTLARSSASYKILITHYPMMSKCSAGILGPNKEIDDKLRAMITTYKPSFIMAGHEHNLQHTVETASGFLMHHYVVGSSAKLTAVMDTTKLPGNARLWFRWPESMLGREGGFSSISVCDANMTVKLYNNEGVEKHSQIHLSTVDSSSLLDSRTAVIANDPAWIYSLGTIALILLIAGIVAIVILVRRRLNARRISKETSADFEPLVDESNALEVA